MKKTNQITTINTTDTTNTTNTNNTKGEITMKNTRTKKHSFKTRLIATALSAITIYYNFIGRSNVIQYRLSDSKRGKHRRNR